MQNFRDLTEMAVEAGVAVQLADDPEKEMSAITHLLDDADSRSRIEKAAIQLIRENRGAAQRYAERIAQAIEDHG
jgi:3-deoxy-D-manno-octulosonic-acid transferase